MLFIDECLNFYHRYCSPIIFDNIERPPFWPVIVMALIIFLAVTEIASQSCADGNCNQFKDVEPGSEITSKSIDSLISRVSINHTVVGWRRALILAMLLSLIILFFYDDGLPHGFDFFLVATIIFLTISLTSNWLEWHWWKARNFKMEDELLLLRSEVKEREIKKEISREKNYYGDMSVMNHIESILY